MSRLSLSTETTLIYKGTTDVANSYSDVALSFSVCRFIRAGSQDGKTNADLAFLPIMPRFG